MRAWACLPALIALALAVPASPPDQVAPPTAGPPSGAVTRTSRPDPDAGKLVGALSGEDAVARFQAEQQLLGMADGALPALERLARTAGFAPARRYAINILARIASQKSIGVLMRILEGDRDVRVRGLICHHLGRFGVEEAVPIIGKWLLSNRGKPVRRMRHPVVLTEGYEWMRHAHALREIGSGKGIPILERMLDAKHGGPSGRDLMRVYRDCLRELRDEAGFWKAVRGVPGLEGHARALFHFFRTDTLATIRLYRMKVLRLGLEGRWVLGDMTRRPEPKLRKAAAALLAAYDRLRKAKGVPQ